MFIIWENVPARVGEFALENRGCFPFCFLFYFGVWGQQFISSSLDRSYFCRRARIETPAREEAGLAPGTFKGEESRGHVVRCKNFRVNIIPSRFETASSSLIRREAAVGG